MHRLPVFWYILFVCVTLFLTGATCSDDDDDSSSATEEKGCCRCTLADSGATINTNDVGGVVDCATVCTAYGDSSSVEWQPGECPTDDDDSTSDDDTNTDDDDDSGETWTDSLSGLTWQVTPPSDLKQWDEAINYCTNLSLDGGGWHLPTISEYRTLIRGCEATELDGSCGVTDSCLNLSCRSDLCDGCSDGGGSAGGCYWPSELAGNCDTNSFWSSSAVALNDDAWMVSFFNGFVGYMNQTIKGGLVRCVRE